MRKRIFSIITALAMLFFTMPLNALAVGNSDAGGLCEHHPSHTADCGYTEGTEGTPCNHEHGTDCYALMKKCVHEHRSDCYSADSVSGNTATSSNAEYKIPTECTHVCGEASGCIIKELDCRHEHNSECGYAECTLGNSCTFACESCREESAVAQTLIDALPTPDELAAMDLEKQQSVYERLLAVSAAYELLTDEQKAEITGAEILDELFAVFSSMTNLLSGEQGHDISSGPVTINDGNCTGDGSCSHIITGSSTTNTITVEAGTHNIIIDNVNIDVSGTDGSCAFSVAGGAAVNLTLEGTNILRSGWGKAGLGVPSGAALTITEASKDGSLEANGGRSSAGIGGDYYNQNGGTITIEGGKVVAVGLGAGAGIGGGGIYGAGGTITIKGGTVKAMTSDPSIPTAPAGIGGSSRGSAGTFTTTDDGSAVIVATGSPAIEDTGNKDNWSGVIFEGNEGQVYGSPTPAESFDIPQDYTLTVPENSILTIDGGITATNEGLILKYGTINGTFQGSGLILVSSTVAVNFLKGSSTVTEADYGDTITVAAAMMQKNNAGRTAAQDTVDFYLGTADSGVKLNQAGIAVSGNQATLEITLTGTNWTIGDHVITADFGGGSGLIGNTGSGTLTVRCDHTYNTNTTDDCTASVQCSICQQSIPAVQSKHKIENWITNGNGTHTGTCTNTIFTGGNCNQIEMEDCSGGTVICTQKSKCTKCNAEYGDAAAHSMTHHAAQAATCTSAGNTEYWSCGRCGKNFSDADGTTELQDVVIPKLEHDWDAWKTNNNGTHSRICRHSSSHIETESCSFGTDNKCITCGGDKPVVIYTVTFDSQGGSPVSSQTIAGSGKVTEPAIPKREGYTFAGWYNGSTKWGFAQDIVTGNLTLTAHWTEDTPIPSEKYRVTVQTNGNGTASASAFSAEKDETITLTAKANPGCYFKEWQVVSGNVTINGNSFNMPANDVTVKAIFEKNSSSDSSSSDGNSGGGSAITDRPIKKHPDIPTTSETKPMKPDKDGNVSIGGDFIQDAINRAATDANKNGSKDKGIAVTVPVDNAADTGSLAIAIPAETLDQLVSAKVRRFDITTGGLPSFSFTLDTLEILDEQSTGGDLILRLTEAAITSAEVKTTIGSRPAYDITLVFIKDGKETPFTDWQGKSVSVKLPYTPAKDEQPGNLYAVCVDTKGGAEWLMKSSYNANQKAVIFEAGYFGIYGVGYKDPAPIFTDTAGHWAADNILFAASRGLLAGTDDNQFSPNTGMTRGMFVTALGRLAGIDPESYKTDKFMDVKADAYYAPYVNWAAEKDIVSGASATTFSPDTNITREQMAAIMANYAKKMGHDLPIVHEAVNFSDDVQISSWAEKEVRAMQQAGIMAGKGGNRFAPQEIATRAEGAAVLRRFVEAVIAPQAAQGWVQDHSGSWQYRKDGKVVTGWLCDDKEWYWLDNNGWMFANGWKQIGGKWYYFYSDGSMAVSTIIDGCIVGPDGDRK